MTQLLAEIGVVVPAWNAARELEACLAALAPAAAAGARIVVVDDGSSDGAGRRVSARFPFARVLVHPERRGPNAAINTGAAAIVGREYLLLLDSDTIAPVESVLRLARALEQRGDHAGAAARLVDRAGVTERSCRRLPRFATPLLLGGTLRRTALAARESERYRELRFDHTCDADIEQPPFTALMLRRAFFDRLGGLDPGFDSYFGDVDFARRLALAGGRLRFVADAVVAHAGGASLALLPEREAVWRRDRLRYFKKHHGALAGPWLRGIELMERRRPLERVASPQELIAP